MEQNKQAWISLNEDELQEVNGGFDFGSLIGGIIDFIDDYSDLKHKP